MNPIPAIPVLPTSLEMLDDKESSSGRECMYFKINDEIGLKTYKRKDRAEFNHNLQKQYEDLSIVPFVFTEVFEIEIPLRNSIYGFMVEHVLPMSDIDDVFCDISEEDEDYIGNIIWDYTGDKLRELLEENCLEYSDFHLGNVGLNKRGRFVILDIDGIYEE